MIGVDSNETVEATEGLLVGLLAVIAWAGVSTVAVGVDDDVAVGWLFDVVHNVEEERKSVRFHKPMKLRLGY